MKSTGIIRKVDQFGRIVAPIELRKALGIAEGDSMEIFLDDDKIILKKYEANQNCAVTGNVLDKTISSAPVDGLYWRPRVTEIR